MGISTSAVIFYLAALCWVVWRGRILAQDGDMFNIFGRNAGLLRATSGYLSLIGAGELITISQLGFDNGYGLLWFPGGIAAGFVLLGALGEKVRVRAGLIGANTFVGYVTRVYGRASGTALFVVFLFSLGALLTIQFIVGGQLLTLTTNIPPTVTSLILAAVIVGYLLVGGYVAVLSTDVLRLVFLAIIIAVLGFAVAIQGGETVGFDSSLYSQMPFADGFTLFILGFFGAVCAGDVWQTVLASRSKAVLTYSMFLAAIAFIVFGLLIGSLGMAAKQALHTLPSDTSALAAAIEHAIPPSLAPFTALMIVGSVMATADTEVWVISTSLISLLKPTYASSVEKTEFQSETQTRVRFAVPVVAGLALFFGYVGRDAQALYEGLLVLLTAIAPAILAILFDVRRPVAIMIALWAALISFTIISAIYRLAPPPSLTFLPVGCSLIGLIVGLMIDEVNGRRIEDFEKSAG
jgi:Na+/proline symporter